MIFDATVIETEPEVRLRVLGEIDLATVMRFRSALGEAFERGSRVVIDLRAVDFIDSVGVGVLIGAVRRAKRSDIELFIEPSSRVLNVFRQCDVDSVLPIRLTVTEAAADGIST